ncbi:MAG: secretin N-terminal domain-containing protein [Alphaproteobacteria bacterium]
MPRLFHTSWCLCLAALLALPGCGLGSYDKIDPSGNLSRKDYRALRDRPVADEYQPKDDAGAPPIPELIVPAAQPGASSPPEKLVTIAVTDKAPLRDVLVELARSARLNLELDPRVAGGVIFSARQQPLTVVLERLCDLAGLRYELKDGFLRVTLDEPYAKTYRIDYLNLGRKTESEVAISTNVFDADVTSTGSNGVTTTGARGGSGNGDNNSTAKVKSEANADFWGELEKNLANILSATGQARNPALKDAPVDGRFSINRQTGLIAVFANGRQQKAVEHFIREARRFARAQVLIEARIVEVELGDKYRSGINWRSLFDQGFNAAAKFGPAAAGAPFVTAATATDGLFTATYSTKDFAAILNLVREFGATRVLSAPRLTTLNNQTAVLKVARNEVYFTTSAQFPTTVTTGGVPVSGTPVFTSTPRTVPVGLVMTVQPSIDLETQDVTLTLRPTVSRVVDRVSDPSIGLNAAQSNISAPIDSKIPVLAVREMDSVLRMHSGEVAVMGGLMQDSSINNDAGVPFFDEVPVLGNLGRSRDNNGSVTELVILLRATITDQPRPDSADAALYHAYNRDPRAIVAPSLQVDEDEKSDDED